MFFQGGAFYGRLIIIVITCQGWLYHLITINKRCFQLLYGMHCQYSSPLNNMETTLIPRPDYKYRFTFGWVCLYRSLSLLSCWALHLCEHSLSKYMAALMDTFCCKHANFSYVASPLNNRPCFTEPCGVLNHRNWLKCLTVLNPSNSAYILTHKVLPSKPYVEPWLCSGFYMEPVGLLITQIPTKHWTIGQNMQ